jgi:hypothetical protein
LRGYRYLRDLRAERIRGAGAGRALVPLILVESESKAVTVSGLFDVGFTCRMNDVMRARSPKAAVSLDQALDQGWAALNRSAAIAFFTLGFAALKPNSQLPDGWYIALVVVGLLIVDVRGGDGTRCSSPPVVVVRPTFVAFIAWTIGTTGIAPIIFESWPSGVSDFILAAAIFLVPGADLRLTRRGVSIALDAAPG